MSSPEDAVVVEIDEDGEIVLSEEQMQLLGVSFGEMISIEVYL